MSGISVVVPSFNHERFIERTLRSIFAQTEPIEKLLVIDDGSRDGSAAVIESVLRDSPIDCELQVRENRGLSATLNEGFAATGSEFFAYIGSDDLWRSDFLAQQLRLLRTRPAAVLAFSHAFLIDEDDTIIDRTDNWTSFADGDVLPYLLRGQVFSSPGVVYRRSALERHSWNEDSILEDYELYLKLSADGEFARNSNVLCGWRQHGSNVSRNFPRMLEEWIKAQDKIAGSLPISRRELDQMQSGLRFDSVASLVRGGYRAEARRLFRENLGGARSVFDMLRMASRLAVPQTLFEANRRRKLSNTKERYGKFPG
ncbi:MAG: glycosyltransferase family 2 protein [Pyrinomonadaceae bacterium]